MINHGIILPLKENYSLSKSGAVSIWVKEYIKHSKYKKNITVFGSKIRKLPLTSNFIGVELESRIFTNFQYIKKINSIIKKKKLISAEIHNRPEYAFYLFKKSNIKINLIFHNDPNTLRGSKTKSQKINLLQNCHKIIFVSNFLKKKFFKNLDFNHQNNVCVIPNSIDIKKKLPTKKNYIVFAGKLNSQKGYNIFGKSITKILDSNKNWSAYVFGNEPREKLNFKHKRLFIKNWISHLKLLKFYERSSISVVNPTWDEPFGRTAMESASRGCAVITSNSGGLQETFFNNLILKKNNEKYLTQLLQKLINDKILLKKIQLFNLKNVKNSIIDVTKELDDTVYVKKINLISNKNKRILHISNFGEKQNHRIFNLSISKKLTNGFIMNNNDVINFDYRERKKIFEKSIDKKIIDICENYKPNLVLMGHNNILQRNTIEKIKNDHNAKFSIWYEDHVVKGDPSFMENLNLLERNADIIDKYFITTHPSCIKTTIKKNKLHFLPVPVDQTMEYGHFYNENKTKDLFFALSHGVNFGKLKKNTSDERYKFLDKLIELGKNRVNFHILGMNGEQPQWNFKFNDNLKICKTALNLSRGGPSKYATSNRLASLIGNGMATFIDEKVKYQDFFDESEMVFYKNINDLVEKLLTIKSDSKKYQNIGKRGKRKYFKLFSNKIVSDFILSKSLNINEKFKYAWR